MVAERAVRRHAAGVNGAARRLHQGFRLRATAHQPGQGWPGMAGAPHACHVDGAALTVGGDKVALVGLSLLVEVDDGLLAALRILERVPHRGLVLVDDQRLDGAHLERLQRVVDPKAKLARVLRDVLEVL